MLTGWFDGRSSGRIANALRPSHASPYIVVRASAQAARTSTDPVGSDQVRRPSGSALTTIAAIGSTTMSSGKPIQTPSR